VLSRPAHQRVTQTVGLLRYEKGQMQKEILEYANVRKENTKQKISLFLSSRNTAWVAQKAFSFYFGETPRAFQEYYIQSIANREDYLSTANFFRVFKQRYALQGIDNNFLDMLEKEKKVILQHIDNNDLSTLYFDFFASAQLQHGDSLVYKNLGSFFAKLVHTFCPDKFCALDNPIKNYFGLGKESFYMAFIIVSQAYQEWAKENPILMQQIRDELEKNSIAKPYSVKMTNLKLLDMIFWYQANRVSENE
jgi:hypothetical protein